MNELARALIIDSSVRVEKSFFTIKRICLTPIDANMTPYCLVLTYVLLINKGLEGCCIPYYCVAWRWHITLPPNYPFHEPLLHPRPVNLLAFTTEHISAHALLLNEWFCGHLTTWLKSSLKQAHCGHRPDYCVSHTSSVVSLWQTNRIPVWKASSFAKCQLPVLYVLPANPPFRKQFRYPIHSKHIYVILMIPNN